MPARLARPRKTVADLRAVPEGVHRELIAGEIYVSPAPSVDHQRVVVRLLEALQSCVRAGAGGEVLPGPCDVHLRGGHVVQPDLLWVAPGRLSILSVFVRGAPDLLVEVVSPNRPERDRVVKRVLYAEAGVREYWVVDPEARGVEVLRSEGGAYRPAGWFTGGQRLRSFALPDLDLAVDDLFPSPPPPR